MKQKHRAAASRLTKFYRWLNETYPPAKPVKNLYFVSNNLEVHGDEKVRGAYNVGTLEIAVLMRRHKGVGPTPMVVLAHEYAHHLQQFGQWPVRAWTPKNMRYKHPRTGKLIYRPMPRREQWAFMFAFIAIKQYRVLMARRRRRFARRDADERVETKYLRDNP